MLSSLTSPLTPFVDALPLPARRLAREHQGSLRVRLRTGSHRFHRDLPESRVWTYDGTLPGPTIEAERGHPVRVDWRNELEGKLPVAVTLAPTATDRNGIPVQCLPGLSGGIPDANAASLPGFAVVHLHGGLTAAAYDGWAENIFAPGQHAVGDYAMDQRAALLWYHDHVMSVTRFTVYAGLAGLWIVRDERERDLGLPEGPPLEVPLLLQDRNFGQDPQGRLTGELVHKTDTGTMEAFAPFTTVNGKVWPVLEVRPAAYRLRVVNGSNARTFRLVLLGDAGPELDRICQIGTDGGLLRAPVAVPPHGLVLASAERADLLVDFSDLPPGSELTLVNTATAPFDGAPFPAERALWAANLDGLLPYPDVMRFRVVPGPSMRRPVTQQLATDSAPPTDRDLAGAVRRAVALVEQELDDAPNMLTMRELAEVPDDDSGKRLITVVDQGTDGQTKTVARFRTAACHFEDTVTFFPVLGRWEVWQLINLTGDTHPIHIHLNAFHVLARRPIMVTVPDGGITDTATSARVRLGRSPDDALEHVLDANEQGLKDTVRVNPNEIVELAVRFEGFSGRYMYHCHILEHEDRDMMRPIVVMPEQLGPFMS
jgi:o-aminophenol oxidase